MRTAGRWLRLVMPRVEILKQAFTAAFKEQAVKWLKDGKRVTAVAKEVGLVDQTPRHRVKA